MHEGGSAVDLNWFSQLILTVFLIAVGVVYLVRNSAAKYFEVVGAGFERDHMTAVPVEPELCAVCGKRSSKRCSRCKSARYCSSECQKSDWSSGHKRKCKDSGRDNSTSTGRTSSGFKESAAGSKSFSTISLVPLRGKYTITQKPGEVLFPYDEFVKYFNWDMSGLVPCGLINCGNSCFANVVLQCLSLTQPLVAYLVEKGHKRECRHNDWCFFCEFQTHVERAIQSRLPFSPINILSRLPNINGNLGYGRQEDAHEFMRFVIDTMQSVSLDEFGGEKVVPPSAQETTLIQHIFGGRLQSQVMCTVCNQISNQYENMMDLTVEIHGDASSLEECLYKFTEKEWLHGENMYKCDRCNDYVKACKRLSIRRAPNILTIALKRFQGGRFGKLNKRVSFPETLDLSPYMSEGGDGTDVYKLYAVIVHLDMLNASFFGHYICYTKDFLGNWYRIDDSEVLNVELEEVLSQRAYMLLYSRIQARPSCLRTDAARKEKKMDKVETESCQKESVESSSITESTDRGNSSVPSTANHSSISHSEALGCEKDSSSGIDSISGRECDMINFESNLPARLDKESSVVREHQEDSNMAIDSEAMMKDPWESNHNAGPVGESF